MIRVFRTNRADLGVYNGEMQASISETTSLNRAGLGARLLLMASVLGALILGSSWTRQLPPGQKLTIWINILFFVALGAADELVLAPELNQLPVGRAAALTAETLVLGWFFSPGREQPASKTLFFVHIVPFFLAVFGGVLGAMLFRQHSHVA
jgi:hypothetical protein